MTFLVTLTYQTFSQSKSFALFDPNSVLFSLIKNPDCRHAFLALYSSLSPHRWSWHPYHQTHSLQFSPHSWALLGAFIFTWVLSFSHGELVHPCT